MFAEKKSAQQNIIIQRSIFHSFFCPTNTAAKAIHPRPLEIFGTKDEILILKRHPAKELYKAAIPHPIVLIIMGFIPLDSKTSESVPVIRKYSPYRLLYKKVNAINNTKTVNIIEKIRTWKRLKLKYCDVKTPRFPNNKDDKQDGRAEKNRFNAIPAMNLFALNFSINNEKTVINITHVRQVKMTPKKAECVVMVNV